MRSYLENETGELIEMVRYLWENSNSLIEAEAEGRIYASVNLPSLAQVRTCRQVGAKPLPKPMLKYYQF